jgi:hypothetical protein
MEFSTQGEERTGMRIFIIKIITYVSKQMGCSPVAVVIMHVHEYEIRI